MLAAGHVSADEYAKLENTICLGCVSCAFFGTANTMCSLDEAIGLSLSGSGLIPAAYTERLRSSFEAGRKIVELCEKDIKPEMHHFVGRHAASTARKKLKKLSSTAKFRQATLSSSVTKARRAAPA